MSVTRFNTNMNCVGFATIYSHHVRIYYSGQKYNNVFVSRMTYCTSTTYNLAVEIFRRDSSLWWRYTK